MATPKTVAHLDTSILLLLIGFQLLDEKTRQFCNKIMYIHHLKISQFALGEAAAVISEKAKSIIDAERYLDAGMRVRKKAKLGFGSFPPPTNEVIEIARELIACSAVVSNMDALILAQAIADKDADFFYTTDKRLKNDRVKKYIKARIEAKKRDKWLEIVVVALK